MKEATAFVFQVCRAGKSGQAKTAGAFASRLSILHKQLIQTDPGATTEQRPCVKVMVNYLA